MAECSLSHLEEVRRNWPFLRDRRIDSYRVIVHRLIDDPAPADNVLVRVNDSGSIATFMLSRQEHSSSVRIRNYRAGSACPPNGSPTMPPGLPGRTTAKIGRANSLQSRGFTRKLFAICTRRAGLHSGGNQRPLGGSANAVTGGCRIGPGGFLGLPYRSCLDERLRSYVYQTENRRKTELAITNWKFNAWAKYSNWKKDNQIPAKISTALGLRQWEPIVETASAEGGLFWREEASMSTAEGHF